MSTAPTEAPRDIVDLAEIAKRLRKSPATVKGWAKKGALPPPTYGVIERLSFCHWEWEHIRQWAEDTGRVKGGPIA